MPDPRTPDGGDRGPDVHDPRIAEAIRRYWRKNVRIMAICLAVWAVAGLGCGVLFADALNRFSLGGFPLGFWFAQQGSILTFVLVILAYGLALNRLDADHHRELERIRAMFAEGGTVAPAPGAGPRSVAGVTDSPSAADSPPTPPEREP